MKEAIFCFVLAVVIFCAGLYKMPHAKEEFITFVEECQSEIFTDSTEN